MGMKNYGKARNVILPENIGKLYYLHGYEQHKNILLDVIDNIFPQAGRPAANQCTGESGNHIATLHKEHSRE